MKQYKPYIIIGNLIIVLCLFVKAVSTKETTLKEGQLVLLELAPVDPRSLIQGDYMRLRYAFSRDFNGSIDPKIGYCIVQLDSLGVAKTSRFQKEATPIHAGEFAIKYSGNHSWNLKIGAESFFFQEGHAERYEAAKYGGLKIDPHGNSILIGLYDEQHQKIQ